MTFTHQSDGSGYLSIGLFILALALASYLIRIVVPLGRSVSLFVYFLSFPTIAYLPQYLSFFVLGAIASRHDWFRTIPSSMGKVGFAVAVGATVTLFSIGFVSFLKAIEAGSPQPPPWGYGTWQSGLYALWDSTIAVGLCLGLIPFFRRRVNGQGPLGRSLAQHSYTVYIIHIPIIVYLALALRGIRPPAILKFGLMAAIVVPTCFAVAYIIRKIPGASRVL